MAPIQITYPSKITYVIIILMFVCLSITVVAAQTKGLQENATLTDKDTQALEGIGLTGEPQLSLGESEKVIVGSRRSQTSDIQIATDNTDPGISPWRTFGSLLIVLALIIAVTYIFRRLALGGKGGFVPSGVEVLARNSINPKQSLCLIKLGPRVLLLGLSPNQMTALHTIEDPDEVAEVVGNLAKTRSKSITNSFGKLLHRESRVYEEEGFDQGESNLDDEQNQQWSQAQGELTSLLDKVKGLTRMRFRS